MNFIETLIEEGVVFDNIVDFNNNKIDIDKLSNLRNIECKCTQSKIDKNKNFYKWFIDYNNKTYQINLSRKTKCPIYFDIYCKNCGKLINKKLSLSNMFNFKNYNFLKICGHKECKKCSARNNAINSQEKCKKTCLERYGYEYTFQRPEQKEQSIKTKIKKYGKDYKKVLARKFWEIYYQKTGYKHNMHNPESLNKMVNSWKETISKKPKAEIIEWHKKRMEAYDDPNSPGMFGYKNGCKSKISQEYFDMVENNLLGYNLIREKCINNYRVDGIIENICIFEFYGDYFHANPEIYNKSDKLKFIGNRELLVEDIWNKDNIRLQEINDFTKLPILIIWEKDFKKNKNESIIKTISLIKEIIYGKHDGKSIITIY